MKIDKNVIAPIVRERKRMGAGFVTGLGSLQNTRGGKIIWPEGDPTVPLDSLDMITSGDLGEILADGRHSAIFIQDTGSSRWVLENTPHESKKYHLFHCSTINEMKRSGRFERYVLSQRTDGFFRAHTDERNGDFVDAELQLCSNCFSVMKSSDIEMSLEDFDLNDYLAVSNNYNWAELPLKNEWSRRDWGYPLNWKKISRDLRGKQNWRCENCYVDCSAHKGLLDVHHRNGVKPDVRHRNLQVLCKLCHQEQDFHGHYSVKLEDELKIKQLRVEQNRDVA